jgi:hypothetical protein
MKYQCAKCSEVFTHTAKQIDQSSFYLAIGNNNEKVLGPTGTYPKLIVETAVCPFCHNIKFTEFIEPIEELEDVISVEYVNVGAKIAEGYKVKEIYAKSVTLVKPKPKVERDYIVEAIEKAKQ